MATVSQMARRWNVSTAWVRRLCEQGRIAGAYQVEGSRLWLIPADAEKPSTRTGRPPKKEL